MINLSEKKRSRLASRFSEGDDMKKLFICLLALVVSVVLGVGGPAAAEEEDSSIGSVWLGLGWAPAIGDAGQIVNGDGFTTIAGAELNGGSPFFLRGEGFKNFSFAEEGEVSPKEVDFGEPLFWQGGFGYRTEPELSVARNAYRAWQISAGANSEGVFGEGILDWKVLNLTKTETLFLRGTLAGQGGDDTHWSWETSFGYRSSRKSNLGDGKEFVDVFVSTGRGSKGYGILETEKTPAYWRFGFRAKALPPLFAGFPIRAGIFYQGRLVETKKIFNGVSCSVVIEFQ
jgi:hypothetical protein